MTPGYRRKRLCYFLLIPCLMGGLGALEAAAQRSSDPINLVATLNVSLLEWQGRTGILVVPVKQTVTYRASFGHVELFQEYRKPLRSK